MATVWRPVNPVIPPLAITAATTSTHNQKKAPCRATTTAGHRRHCAGDRRCEKSTEESKNRLRRGGRGGEARTSWVWIAVLWAAGSNEACRRTVTADDDLVYASHNRKHGGVGNHRRRDPSCTAVDSDQSPRSTILISTTLWLNISPQSAPEQAASNPWPTLEPSSALPARARFRRRPPGRRQTGLTPTNPSQSGIPTNRAGLIIC